MPLATKPCPAEAVVHSRVEGSKEELALTHAFIAVDRLALGEVWGGTETLKTKLLRKDAVWYQQGAWKAWAILWRENAGLFLQVCQSSQIGVFFLFVLWTGPCSFLRHIFSAADKTTVIPSGANGKENLTGPIRFEASEWDSSLKGEHPEVILWQCNSKHQTLQGRESYCQASVLVSANSPEMPGSSRGPLYPGLQDCSTLWWYWKTHSSFLPFFFVLCLSISILKWDQAPSGDSFPVLYLALSVNSVYFFQCNIA